MRHYETDIIVRFVALERLASCTKNWPTLLASNALQNITYSIIDVNFYSRT